MLYYGPILLFECLCAIFDVSELCNISCNLADATMHFEIKLTESEDNLVQSFAKFASFVQFRSLHDHKLTMEHPILVSICSEFQ